MRVLFFDPYYEGVYGNARYVNDLFNHEKIIGCTFYTCSPEVPDYLNQLVQSERFFHLTYDANSRLSEFGGSLSGSNFLEQFKVIKDILSYSFRFKDLCKKEDIDVVHCNSIRAILTVGVGAKLAGCRVVLYIKSNLVGYIYCILSFFLADLILFQTETNKSRAPKSLLILFKYKFRILKNAIDMTRINKASLASSSQAIEDIEAHSIKLIYIGSIVERKGLRYLVNALKRIKIYYPEFKLYIVGDEKQDQIHTLELKDLIRKNDLQDNISFLGHKKEPLNLLRIMDALILPSLDEGVPKSVIEAICIGVPVIATDVGGTAETIDNLNNGIIVDPGNENELYKGIKRFLQNKIHFVETAKRMSSEAIKVFSFSQHSKELSRIYKELTIDRTH